MTSTSSQLFLNAVSRFGFDYAHIEKRNILILDNFFVLKSDPNFLSKILISKQMPVKNVNVLIILVAVLMSQKGSKTKEPIDFLKIIFKTLCIA